MLIECMNTYVYTFDQMGGRSSFLCISPKIILIIFLESTSREELKSALRIVCITGKVVASTGVGRIPIFAPHPPYAQTRRAPPEPPRVVEGAEHALLQHRVLQPPVVLRARVRRSEQSGRVDVPSVRRKQNEHGSRRRRVVRNNRRRHLISTRPRCGARCCRPCPLLTRCCRSICSVPASCCGSRWRCAVARAAALARLGQAR